MMCAMMIMIHSAYDVFIPHRTRSSKNTHASRGLAAWNYCSRRHGNSILAKQTPLSHGRSRIDHGRAKTRMLLGVWPPGNTRWYAATNSTRKPRLIFYV